MKALIHIWNHCKEAMTDLAEDNYSIYLIIICGFLGLLGGNYIWRQGLYTMSGFLVSVKILLGIIIAFVLTPWNTYFKSQEILLFELVVLVILI